MSSLPDYETLKSAITTCWDRSKSNNNWITFLDSIPKADNTSGAREEENAEGTQDNNQELLTFIANTDLVEILSEADLHASDLLSTTADRLGVKSWQLSEYVELLKEELSLTSDEYIRYEKAESSEASQTPEQPATSSSSTPAAAAPAESLPATTIDPAQLLQSNAQPKSQSLVPLLLSGIGILLLILIAVLFQKNEKASQLSQASQPEMQASKPSSSWTPPKPKREEPTTQNSVYFQGIDLPITNKICNKKGSFCIYNLAKLVDDEKGSAYYEFREINKGKLTHINGSISIGKIERINNMRKFTFEWEDDLRTTSPEFAATGYFRLDQDTDKSKPGILTRFVTTRSFGSKTPVGQENTSYLFPR